MSLLTSFIWTVSILYTTFLIDSILGDKCVDTNGWHDNINNSTCSDYVAHGWCVDNSLTVAMKTHAIPSLNFPELNCCACGKKASLNLSPTARWTENATTVAGSANGTYGSSLNMLDLPKGISIDDTNTLYIADYGNNRVVSVSLNFTDTDVGQISHQFMFMVYDIIGIHVTQTSIYNTDWWNYRVQKRSKNSSNPLTVAGVDGIKGNSTSLTTLNGFCSLFVDNYANIVVSDSDNHRVMMFPWNSTNGTSGMIVAGTGFPGSGTDELRVPYNVFVDDHGELYIADFGNNRIQKWILGAREGVTVAGTGIHGNSLSQLYGPTIVLVDLNKYMYISDGNNNRIMRWALGAQAGECIAGCSGGDRTSASRLFAPESIAFDSRGSLYVSDRENNRIQRFQLIDEIAQSTTQDTITTTLEATLITQNSTTTTLEATLITQNSTTTSSKSNLIKSHVFITTIAFIFVHILV